MSKKVKQCVHCKKEFVPYRAQQVFCSTRCRVAQWRASASGRAITVGANLGL